jgi:alkylation response protein AidB-like acyl-CoA dehydrogenase
MTSDELSSAVRTLVRRHVRDSGPASPFDPGLWRGLGQMGVLGLATRDGGGTAADLCRCILELGAAGTVGPIVETVIAGQLELGAESAAVLGGERLATVTWYPDLVPWGELADIVIYVRGDSAFRAAVVDATPVATLAGEVWTAGDLSPGEDLGPAGAGATLGELAAASYVTGAGLRIIEGCAEYAAERRQFGRAIGDYQAVSHPLAEAYARLAGLQDVLAGDALAEMDLSRPEAAERAPRLRLAASQAAARASYVGFQTQGGMGFVDGTELAHLGKRIRQVSLAGVPQRESVSRATAQLAV